MLDYPPILIVGAGPTGLTLALTLVKNGASVRIIEKRTEPFIGQRGGAIMPRTLELHKLLGTLPDIQARCGPPLFTDLFLPQGREPVRTFEMAPHIDPTPDRPLPNPVFLWQSRQEELLRDHLQKMGVEVEFGVELRSFENNLDSVTVTLIKRSSDGYTEETTTTPYLISAEGAHSIVRKKLGLTFYGTTTSQSYVIGDIEVLDGLNRDKWFFCGETSSKMISLCASEDLTTKYMYMLFTGAELDHMKVSSSRDELIKEIYEVTGRTEIQFGNLLWMNSYTPNIRTVESFSKGRCFVAGDAAHIFALSGAQGLNSGIHDAVNLAWKLAAVMRGISPESLLESYSAERLPVISGMLDKTREVHEKTFSTSITDEDNDAWDRGGDFDMLHMHYRGSPIVLDTIHPVDAMSSPFAYVTGRQVRGGDRAPDAPGLVDLKCEAVKRSTSLFEVFGISHHTVLIFARDLSAASDIVTSLAHLPADAIKSVLILEKGSPTAGVSSIPVDHIFEDSKSHGYDSYLWKDNERSLSVVIIRPDSYIGAMVDTAAGVKEYFSKIFV